MRNWLQPLWRSVRVARSSKPNRTAKPARPTFRPAMEFLEDRCTPSSGMTSIAFNFNSSPIAAGSTLWFSSALQAKNLGTGPVTLQFTAQTITYTANGSNYSVNVPNGTVDFLPTTKTASTTFDPVADAWTTTIPSSLAGNDFLSGVAVAVPGGLPGGIHNVTWQGQMQSSTANVQVQWHWGAVDYSSFSTDYTTLGIKPCDDAKASSYSNGDHAGTPEAFKASVSPGGTGGQQSPNASVTPPLPPPPGVTYISGSSSDYPFTSSNPLTSVVFNENDVLTAAALNTNNNTFDVWYTDEHALTLGVNQVTVIAANGTSTTTNYSVTPLTSDPGSATNPAVGDQAAGDPSGRPLAPSLFITDITSNSGSRSGDWQYGGTAIAPGAVFGTWKSYSETINNALGGLITLTGANDPASNGTNLGAGADAPPPGLSNQGYTAEVRWSLTDLAKQGVLLPGHNYRFYVMVHDGDQNKSGGDVGQASYQLTSPIPAPSPATISGFVSSPTGPVAGDVITLTGTDINGNAVTLTAVTDSNGYYQFTSLTPGNYVLTDSPLGNLQPISATAGTDNGVPDGTSGINQIGSITLGWGDVGINYNFFLQGQIGE